MALGAGKYDDVCTIVREKTDARFVAVIVMGGNQGDGFSVQVTNRDLLKHLPGLLNDLTKQVSEDVASWGKI